MDSIEDHIHRLEEEVEKKYRDSIAALRQLRETLVGTVAVAVPHPGVPAPQETQNGHERGTLVKRVVLAIRDNHKTVEQLATELKFPPAKIRAVLYAKAYKTKIHRKQIGNVQAFKLKPIHPPTAQSAATSTVSAAASVLDLLTRHRPEGLTVREILVQLGDGIQSKNPRNAISSACYNMHKAGKLTYDDLTKKFTAK